jgi:hypothetical protein
LLLLALIFVFELTFPLPLTADIPLNSLTFSHELLKLQHADTSKCLNFPTQFSLGRRDQPSHSPPHGAAFLPDAEQLTAQILDDPADCAPQVVLEGVVQPLALVPVVPQLLLLLLERPLCPFQLVPHQLQLLALAGQLVLDAFGLLPLEVHVLDGLLQAGLYLLELDLLVRVLLPVLHCNLLLGADVLALAGLGPLLFELLQLCSL